MTNKDAFSDRRRALEDEYFRKKDKALIEKMRRRILLEVERRKMARAIGAADDETLRDLQEMGYTPDMLMLLHLVPLVQVAWAEGRVTRNERGLIFEVARLRGIKEDSPAFKRLVGWLDQRPSEAFFEKTLKIITALIEALPPDRRKADKQDLVAYCVKVAEASGNFLGLVGLTSKVCSEEQELLKRIAAVLEPGRKIGAVQVQTSGS